MALFAVEYTYSDATASARDEHRPKHRAWLGDLVDQGIVRATGPWTDGSGALILVDVADEAAARELMGQDRSRSATSSTPCASPGGTR